MIDGEFGGSSTQHTGEHRRHDGSCGSRIFADSAEGRANLAVPEIRVATLVNVAN